MATALDGADLSSFVGPVVAAVIYAALAARQLRGASDGVVPALAAVSVE